MLLLLYSGYVPAVSGVAFGEPEFIPPIYAPDDEIVIFLAYLMYFA